MYIFTDINTKQICNILEQKHFAPLRMLYVFIKSFVNPFVDIAITFSDSLFSSFSLSTCFVLFEVISLSKFFSLSSKSVIFTKLAILFLFAKFGLLTLQHNFLLIMY